MYRIKYFPWHFSFPAGTDLNRDALRAISSSTKCRETLGVRGKWSCRTELCPALGSTPTFSSCKVRLLPHHALRQALNTVSKTQKAPRASTAMITAYRPSAGHGGHCDRKNSHRVCFQGSQSSYEDIERTAAPVQIQVQPPISALIKGNKEKRRPRRAQKTKASFSLRRCEASSGEVTCEIKSERKEFVENIGVEEECLCTHSEQDVQRP